MDTRPPEPPRRETREIDRHDPERGFTLVELVTVVMIIGVLIAIVVPSFLRARRPAEDRQAQTLLRTGLSTAAVAPVDSGAAPDATALAAAEPSVHFVDASTDAEATDHRVSVATGTVGGRQYVLMVSHSAAGRCYAVLSVTDRPPQYQRTDGGSCEAADLDPATGWSDAWP